MTVIRALTFVSFLVVLTVLAGVATYRLKLKDYQFAGIQHSVKVVQISGSVQVKSRGHVRWTGAREDQRLAPGEMIYIAEGSSVVLHFQIENAIVQLSGETFFEIENKLKLLSKGNRQRLTNLEKTKNEGEASARHTFQKFVSHDNVEDDLAEKFVATESDLMLAIKKVEILKVLQPTANIDLMARRFPQRFSVKFEKSSNQSLSSVLTGYLWREGSESPVWQGVAGLTFRNIRIPSEGNYIFQAFSDDESFISEPVYISAVKKKTLDFSAYSKSTFEDRDLRNLTVWVR